MSLLMDAPMAVQQYEVLHARKETLDTRTITLAGPDGAAFAFAPGQFNMLYAFGIGEVPISISGDPGRPETIVHTIRAVGAVSSALCNLRPGDTLGVRGPYGTAWPVEAAVGNDLLLAAGGIGMAPLRPALYHALSHREAYGNLVLLYGARTQAELLFKREIEEWHGRFDLQAEVTVDNAVGGWPGHVGNVTTLVPRADFDPAHTIAFVCGPEIMMRFAVLSLQKRGLADDRIYISMERDMKCGIGLCGHCQLGPHFICKDGAVYRYDQIKDWFVKREV